LAPNSTGRHRRHFHDQGLLQEADPREKNWGDYYLVGVSAPFTINKHSKLTVGFAYTKGTENFIKLANSAKIANPAAAGRGVISLAIPMPSDRRPPYCPWFRRLAGSSAGFQPAYEQSGDAPLIGHRSPFLFVRFLTARASPRGPLDFNESRVA